MDDQTPVFTDTVRAQKAAELAQAEALVLAAVDAYRAVLDAQHALGGTPIRYTTSKAVGDNRKFSIESVNTAAPFGRDGPLLKALDSELPVLQALLLSLSSHWEDRIRATVLHETIRKEIVLPDGFPCIYEPADSPHKVGQLFPQPFVWVASPDEAMLRELLPLYRELWGAYEAQWPHSPNRTFEVGRLDGVSPRGVYRPGSTPEQVIGQTMLTHSEMYRTAPEHLKKMHPQHATWTASRRTTSSATN